MSGKVLQDAIVEAARFNGWVAAHFTPAQIEGRWRTPYAYDTKGFPDLILVRDRLVAVEVKGDGDSLRAEQRTWLMLLDTAAVETHVWTPADLRSGRIDTILK
jgi:hypothetical protein